MSVVWNFKEYHNGLVFSGPPWHQVFLTNTFLLPIYSPELGGGRCLGFSDYKPLFGIVACASLPNEQQKLRVNCLAEGQNTVNVSRAWSQAHWSVAQCTDHLASCRYHQLNVTTTSHVLLCTLTTANFTSSLHWSNKTDQVSKSYQIKINNCIKL